MKNNVQQYLLVSVLIILLLSITPLPSLAREKYNLEYKFGINEQLQYKTEKLDSITSSMPNGQEMTRQITSYNLKTLAIQNTPPDNPFTVSITVDSTWSESENDNVPGDRSGNRRARMSIENENQHLTFNKYGKSTTDKAIASPLILPLPEKPVSINDQWDFSITTERKGRFQGETAITGKCLVYDIQQNKGDNIAVIIVNAEISGQGKFNIKTQEREISGTNRSSGIRSSLIYFNIDKGRIDEIVTEEETESATEGSAFSTNMIRTSKSTTKLVNK
ncbi:MAG: hypothetical protein R6V04_08165 [bacterium]